jgi:hypothetical protein
MGRIIGFIFYISCYFVHLNGQVYSPGKTYFGANQYTEYICGNLPVILSAPHGGELNPTNIPDRNCIDCVIINDGFTQELVLDMYLLIKNKTGCYPHAVINRLHRRKLDGNREIIEAANGNTNAENAWYEFHNFTESAKKSVTESFGKGLYLDIHGHSHSKQRLELGYLLYTSELKKSDAILNSQEYIGYSSIKNLVGDNLSQLTHAELLRGKYSLGSLMADATYPSVPSLKDPFPMTADDYFSGGYNIARHGSYKSGTIDGIQIEINSDVRFNESVRHKFAEDLVDKIIDFLDLHYFKDFKNFDCVTSDVNHVTAWPVLETSLADNIFRINTEWNEKFQINVLNLLGINCLSVAGSVIDISNLHPGIYIVQVILENKSLCNKKIIKF